MLSSPTFIAVAIALSFVLSYIAFRQQMLTASGSASAFAVSAAIGVFGSISWLLIILVFVIAAFLTTRFRILEKMKYNLQEGRGGERGTLNVVANSLPAVLIALASTFLYGRMSQADFSIIYVTAVAAATSDTLASEIGVIDRNAVLITNFRRVAPGTDGGISLLGTAAALAGAAFISIVGYVLIELFRQRLPLLGVGIAITAGFLGSIVDSILGAVLERRRIIGKQTNNIASITAACLIALVLVFH